jgi:hypothetical protein
MGSIVWLMGKVMGKSSLGHGLLSTTRGMQAILELATAFC